MIDPEPSFADMFFLISFIVLCLCCVVLCLCCVVLCCVVCLLRDIIISSYL